jgi:hypothetical protein
MIALGLRIIRLKRAVSHLDLTIPPANWRFRWIPFGLVESVFSFDDFPACRSFSLTRTL